MIMKKKIVATGMFCLLLGLIGTAGHVKAQSSITIDASQQITNFVFINGSGLQDNSQLMFGEDNLYKPVYSGAYSFGYSYLLDFGMFIRLNVGMRNAGATMVYDATNYQWEFQYLKTNLGVGYALDMGRINPYLGVSGYYGSLLKANQRINNEDYDIIDSESIQKSDFGLSFPLGVRIDASEFVSVYTEVSYLMGLQNIETADNGQEANNVAYLFTLGLSFAIK